MDASVWYYNFISSVLYNPILPLVKLSVLIFLLQLGGTKCLVRKFIMSMIIFQAFLMIAVFIAYIFQCNPIEKAWRLATPGTCFKQGRFSVASSALSIVTDFIVLMLPFWIFLDLQMNKKVRNALIGIFMLGIL
jgi:hypothetical protein